MVSLDKNLTSEQFQYGNVSNAKDAAPFQLGYMLQLGVDNGIRQIRLSDGADLGFTPLVDVIDAGAGAFGIAYDGSDIIVGRLNNGTMSFHKYDLTTFTFSDLGSSAYDVSQWGTPTSLTSTYQGRGIVGTKDAPPENIFNDTNSRNIFLDMDLGNSTISQYAVDSREGTSFKLESVHFDNGNIVSGYDAAGAGRVQIGNFNVIPEPKLIGVITGLGALGAAYGLRRRERAQRAKEIKRAGR